MNDTQTNPSQGHVIVRTTIVKGGEATDFTHEFLSTTAYAVDTESGERRDWLPQMGSKVERFMDKDWARRTCDVHGGQLWTMNQVHQLEASTVYRLEPSTAPIITETPNRFTGMGL